MALNVLCAAWALLLGTSAALGPVPRRTWQQQEINLKHFQEPGIFNYSTLLLSEDTDVLYIGAREIIFAVNSLDVSEKQHEVSWNVSKEKQQECSKKGKSIQTECLNYVRVLQPLNSSVLYVCGTNAFQPTCGYLDPGRNHSGGRENPLFLGADWESLFKLQCGCKQLQKQALIQIHFRDSSAEDSTLAVLLWTCATRRTRRIQVDLYALRNRLLDYGDQNILLLSE